MTRLPTFSLFGVILSLATIATALPAPQEVDAAAATTFTGDITHYAVGLGSCGVTNTDSQPIVALSVAKMANGPNPNNNPKCGKTITIHNPNTGTNHVGTIEDTCQACALNDLDLSPSLFKAVAPNGDGRVHGIQWHFN